MELLEKTNIVIDGEVVGAYLHGSLAMGGFNVNSSDIDLILVTKHPLSLNAKKELAKLFLGVSSRPFPVEISILNHSQLRKWQHPSLYDFHFSEFWRERYDRELKEGTTEYLNAEEKKDGDLAAHFTILKERGICLQGSPIHEVFPTIPQSDYLSSILEDYEDCLLNIFLKPVYCILNMMRVYLFLQDGTISSKLEAGRWGAVHLPTKFCPIMYKAVNAYGNKDSDNVFDKTDLADFRDYIDLNVKRILDVEN
ncbi:aminoglycoside adenylyltransferase domain-containing protein [Planomicrobium soli]|nr:aminoglycoside adenylyltransferase domain-containing protein [Planomicrobium soli]